MDPEKKKSVKVHRGVDKEVRVLKETEQGFKGGKEKVKGNKKQKRGEGLMVRKRS